MKTNEIRKLLSKATARPWVWAHIFDGENVIQGHRADHVAITEISADAALIVALVNNAEALLAENERLQAEVERLQAVMDGISEQLSYPQGAEGLWHCVAVPYHAALATKEQKP